MRTSPSTRGMLLVLAATAGFASLGTLAGLAYETGMSSPVFVMLRAILGATLIGALLAVRPALRTPLGGIPSHERGMLLLAIVLNGAFNLALFGAFALATVPIALALYFTYPALVAVSSVALGRERFTRARVLGLVVAMVGVTLLLAERLAGAGGAVPLGILLACGAAALQAAYIVVARAGFPSVNAELAIMLVLVGGAVMAAGLAAATDGLAAFDGWSTRPGPWLAVLAAALFGTAAAKVWVLKGLRLIGGTRTAVIMLGEPFGGIVLAAVVLDQPLTPIEAAGGLLIVVAALLVQRAAPGRSGE
ncbi:MAG TPA: DMT family transporter [Candidatus Limnocylindria bacterium]